MSAPQTEKLFSLQAARVMAALAVYLFHVTPQYVAMGGDEQGWLFQASRYGMVGVDVFFVISGYVIYHSTRRVIGGYDSARFLLRRLGRIYLAFWPVFCVTLVINHWYPTTNAWNWFSSGFLLETSVYRLLVPISWSLTFELFFYVGFAPVILIGLERRIRVLFLAGAVAICAVWSTDGKSTFFASPYTLEFLFGVVLAVSRPFLARPSAVLLGLIMIGFGLCVGVKNGSMANPERLLTFGVAAVGVVMALTSFESCWGWTKNSIIARLGDASYALYLVHLPILSPLIGWGLRDLLAQTNAGIGFLGWTVITVAIALLYHMGMEKPMYRAYCRRIDRAIAERSATIGANLPSAHR